jgi:8-amino-7-oxononanoate synthase
VAYQHLTQNNEARENLRKNINTFNQQKQLLGLKPLFVRSKSAIQSAVIPGNEKVKEIANQLQKQGFNVKAILSPTVPEGQERLRICLHSYNSEEEIEMLLKNFSQLIFK